VGTTPTNHSAPDPAVPKLTEPQRETLHDLCRRSAPVLEAHLDGRVLRALVSRGFATVRRGWVTATPEGRAALATLEGADRARARDGGRPRTAAILRAIRDIERVVPTDAEMMVGNAMAAADDVLQALRRCARKLDEMEERGSPDAAPDRHDGAVAGRLRRRRRGAGGA
jgi:hypothetical protein